MNLLFSVIVNSFLFVIFCTAYSHANAEQQTKITQKCYQTYNNNQMELARQYCQQAADQGDRQADYFLSVITFDHKKQLKYRIEDANQGYLPAQRALAEMYFSGRSVSKDFKIAAKWYLKSAQSGDANAAFHLGIIFEQGNHGILADYSQAAHWYTQAANAGNSIAQNNLGNLYRDGKGVTKDYSKAIKWYRKAIEQFDSYATINLGNMYLLGYGAEVDNTKAVNLYKRAAKSGNTEADFLLSKAYEQGLGIEKDLTKAFEWNLKSADKARYDKIDTYWFRKSKFSYQLHAQYKLAYKFEHGIGTPRNVEKAKYWYQLAKENGNKQAKAALKKLVDE